MVLFIFLFFLWVSPYCGYSRGQWEVHWSLSVRHDIVHTLGGGLRPVSSRLWGSISDQPSLPVSALLLWMKFNIFLIDFWHLCNFQHTWTSDPATSCLAAIYFEDAAAIQLRCRVTTEPADFHLERLNGTSFVSKDTTTAQIQCGSRRSVCQLHGTQIGRLAHSCSITAGHSAMAASPDNPPTSSFQIRAILKSLRIVTELKWVLGLRRSVMKCVFSRVSLKSEIVSYSIHSSSCCACSRILDFVYVELGSGWSW